ncbi:MAG: hypothetical protein KJZ68_11600, partial [Phycisphaerales bacterium]|nr:hypothetical protein [Phycisphaerales bacterium]
MPAMTLEARIDRLERQNRSLRAGLGVAGLALLVGGLLGLARQPQPAPDVIKARAFHLVREDGTILLKLEDTYGRNEGVSGTITVFNGKENPVFRVGATPGGHGTAKTFNRDGG